MTQKELILLYLQDNPSITPAKLLGKPYRNGFFGAELSRVCRKMRKENILQSKKVGKFEVFWKNVSIPDIVQKINAMPARETIKIIPSKVEEEAQNKLF